MATNGKPDVVEVSTDLLIVGGGMAACGAAVEARRWAPPEMTITLVDKAAMDRSGAVAMGLSAVNTYLGENTPEDYTRYVKTDLMGITRDDLVYDVGRHVDDSVHLFEKWGLPIWKQKGDEGKPLADGGKPVRSGRWQIMISGESYKVIVAEAAKKALGSDNVYERVFVFKLLRDDKDPNRVAGAVGFSVREDRIYVFRAKAVLVACGGAVHVFRQRSTGEGLGRTWYPPWNSGSTYAMLIQAGAEMTQMENRFVPARFKDGYGPVGAWFLLFKAKALNALGEDYVTKNKPLLRDWDPYGSAAIVPTCLRNHLMIEEMRHGRGPIMMDTPTAMKELAAKMDPKQVRELESEAWEDFLDMTITQAGLWASLNVAPEETPSEIMPAEPYLMGSHAGCAGAWVSGPEDFAPAEYRWGYNRMTTVQGLFTAGDGVGASGHKFSSGSHAEGRIAAKAAVRFVLDHRGDTLSVRESPAALAEEAYRPLATYEKYRAVTTDPTVNPNYIRPKMLMFRLNKIMDEYVGGISTNYTTSEALLTQGLGLLTMLKEDAAKLAAKDLHELMRCWENSHRIWAAEAHLRHILYRQETRYPGYYYRSDFSKLDDGNWRVFANSRHDPATGEWKSFTRPLIELLKA